MDRRKFPKFKLPRNLPGNLQKASLTLRPFCGSIPFHFHPSLLVVDIYHFATLDAFRALFLFFLSSLWLISQSAKDSPPMRLLLSLSRRHCFRAPSLKTRTLLTLRFTLETSRPLFSYAPDAILLLGTF